MIEVICHTSDNFIACSISTFLCLFSIFLVVCLLACFLLLKRIHESNRRSAVSTMPSLSFARQRSALVLDFEVALDPEEEILILSLVSVC